MEVLKWVIILAALTNFGFMTFDGLRGLIKGDYIRPTTGKYAGQLGPWSKMIIAIGIDPESKLMKYFFALWGLIGIFVTICFGLEVHWAWTSLMTINILSLWYLVPGTVLSILQIILLLIILYLN